MKFRLAVFILTVAVVNSLLSLASSPQQNGYYWADTSERMIELQGDRFFVKTENEQSKPISELQPITDGVVFYDNRYWCRSNIAPFNAKYEDDQSVTCTEKGWISVKANLPKYCW